MNIEYFLIIFAGWAAGMVTASLILWMSERRPAKSLLAKSLLVDQPEPGRIMTEKASADATTRMLESVLIPAIQEIVNKHDFILISKDQTGAKRPESGYGLMGDDGHWHEFETAEKCIDFIESQKASSSWTAEKCADFIESQERD